MATEMTSRPCPACGYSAANGEFCEDEFLEPCPCGEAPWAAGEPAPQRTEAEDQG